MSAVTRSIVKEEFEDIGIEPGPGEADVDISELEEISNGLSNDHDELAQVLDEAKIFSDVKDQFPEGTILTVSEEKILNAMVNLIGAGSGGTISAESLRVFKRDTVGTQLSMEALEGGVWETIKRIFKAIAERIRAFWNWLTSSSEKKIEERQEKTLAGMKAHPKSLLEMSDEELMKHLSTLSTSELQAIHKGLPDTSSLGKKVAKESFEYTPEHAPKIHKITGHQLTMFTDQAPRGTIVFADDVVEEMTKTLDVSKKILDILQENELGKVIEDKGTEESIVNSVVEVLGRQIDHLGMGGGKELRVVGTYGLKYEVESSSIQPVTLKTDIEPDKSYVIGIRSGSELIRKYGDYVTKWKSFGFGSSSLNHLADELDKYAENTAVRPDAGRGEVGNHALTHFAKFTSVLLSALARIVRSSAVLEKQLLSWIPVS
ncbi:MAG TPA: hypothetical protein VN081_05070 [Dongiaceae bacterium]|nr:hypothetical protein [Dongiaceae bacterium]